MLNTIHLSVLIQPVSILIERLNSPNGYHYQGNNYQNSHISSEVGSVSMALPLLGQIEIVVRIHASDMQIGIGK